MRLTQLLAALAVAAPFGTASAATITAKFCPKDNAVPAAMVYAYDETDAVRITSASQALVEAGRVAYLTCATEKCAIVFMVPASVRSYSGGMANLQGGIGIDALKQPAGTTSHTVCLYATYYERNGNVNATWAKTDRGCHCNVH